MDNVLFKKIINVFCGTALIQGANIILYMVLARLMPMEEFATYRQLFLIQSIISAISFSAIPTALLYFCNDSKSLRIKWSYIKSIFILVVVLGLLIALGIFLARDIISLVFSNPELAESLRVFSLVPLTTMLVSMLASVFIVIDKTTIQVRVAVIISLIKVIPIILVAYVYSDFQSTLTVTVFSNIVAGFIAVLLMVYFGLPYKLKLPVFKLFIPKLWMYSFPLLLASSASILGLKIDHLVVSSLLGTSVYALYTVGAFEIPIFSLIQNSVTSVLIPQITKDLKNKEYSSATKLWKKASYKSALFGFPVAILFIIKAKYIITLLFGEKYEASAPFFALFSTLVLIRLISFGLGLRAMGKTNLEFYCTLIYLISSFIGAYLFTATFGALGAALWVVANTFLYSALLSFVTAKASKYNLKLWDIYPLKLLALAITITFAVWFIQITTINSHLSFILTLTEILVFWCLGVWLLNEKFFKKDNPK